MKQPIECPMCGSDQVRLIDINCCTVVGKCEWCQNVWRVRDEKANVS